jgi:hypothetical protein
MPKQIGWSNESNLLYQISQQISRLINVTGVGGGSITGTGTANYITRWTSSSSLNNSVIYQSSTGNIGIGTTTPSRKLDVNGDVNIAQLLVVSSDIYSSRVLTNAIVSNTFTYIPFISSQSPFGEIMRVDNGGGLLIGTTVPNGNKLQVAGTSQFISSSTAGTSVILGNVNFQWNFNTSIAPQILSLGYGAINVLNIGYDAPDGLIRIYNGGNIQFSTNYFSVGGDANNPVSSARMNIESTTQGVLKPRMTTTQINAIATPAIGLEAYNTTLQQPCFYDGIAWRKVTHSTM